MTLGEVERRTLAALETHLADPDTIAARIRAAQVERNQATREARALRRVAEDRLAEINTAINESIAFARNGGEDPVELVTAGVHPQVSRMVSAIFSWP